MKKPLSIKSVGKGHFKVTFLRYNKEITCITTNTMAIDRIRDTNEDKRIIQLKKRLITLYMRNVNLNKMKIKAIIRRMWLNFIKKPKPKNKYPMGFGIDKNE